MLASGSTITSKDWDRRNGPTCRANWTRTCRRPRRHHGIDGPLREHSTDTIGGQRAVMAWMNVASSSQSTADANANRAARRDGAHEDRGPPSAGGRSGRALARLGRHDEGGDRRTGQTGRSPGHSTDGLVNPQTTEHEREDELGHEQGRDGRDESVVEGDRLEGKGCDLSCPSEDPQ